MSFRNYHEERADDVLERLKEAKKNLRIAQAEWDLWVAKCDDSDHGDTFPCNRWNEERD